MKAPVITTRDGALGFPGLQDLIRECGLTPVAMGQSHSESYCRSEERDEDGYPLIELGSLFTMRITVIRDRRPY